MWPMPSCIWPEIGLLPARSFTLTAGGICGRRAVDRILINDLLVRCVIGVSDEERRERQDVVLNIIFFTDLFKAAKSDDIRDAVDYRAVKKRVVAMAETSSFHLVEALAERIADICLEVPVITAVQVRVEKPSVLRFARSVGVEIVRDRGM